uniref:DDE Tnp4 domain-containing protein n=1 Tax=Ditylenchus dipsaci TaxID=166011 RepID=A0A915EJN1_9BILA
MASRKRKNVSGDDLKAEEDGKQANQYRLALSNSVGHGPFGVQEASIEWSRLGKIGKELGKARMTNRLHLAPKYLKTPSTAEEWNRIATKFWKIVINKLNKGAIDGKHILLKAPTNTGSLHYNYKDVGNYGKDSDGGIFGKCSFKEALDRKVLNLPEAKNLSGTDVFTPLFIVGDAAFPLREIYATISWRRVGLRQDAAIGNNEI